MSKFAKELGNKNNSINTSSAFLSLSQPIWFSWYNEAIWSRRSEDNAVHLSVVEGEMFNVCDCAETGQNNFKNLDLWEHY